MQPLKKFTPYTFAWRKALTFIKFFFTGSVDIFHRVCEDFHVFFFSPYKKSPTKALTFHLNVLEIYYKP